ncbi:acetate/propionate family kinase [Streptomyces sp. SP18CS02]|uniref:acetate/propionate family kinase n=1 Tax=Streptomyces sp. SP18CS02 TaxID=3002531 RepID=UPI002E79C895|nr:acetate/propionate family kinase [Streptomyces sp. SP18CS02]MEE1751556.1 acetate/propionate family kinase [Streptomyces sp. SP18CS02]
MNDTNILVVDAGSASLRLAVFDADHRELAGRHLHEAPGEDARELISSFLREAPPVGATGHRVVHGGPRLSRHSAVDDDVRAALDDAARLAPLHVPSALAVLDAARGLLPDVPHVVCLDTVFHTGLPPAARAYGVPREWTERHGLRRYGFHGLSCAWALKRAAGLLGRPADSLQLVLAHLGGGCSATAVRDGHSVDTTMGFTPLEGLVMSKRSGSVDPGMLLWLQTSAGLSAERLSHVLHHESGLLGLSGTSGDTRDLVRAAARGDGAAAFALDVFALNVRRGVARVAASLDRVDALVFTGEIGEDQPEVREAVCAGLGVLGLTGGLAPDNPARDAVVSAPDAKVPVLVIPTGEPQQVAVETRAVLAGRRPRPHPAGGGT